MKTTRDNGLSLPYTEDPEWCEKATEDNEELFTTSLPTNGKFFVGCFQGRKNPTWYKNFILSVGSSMVLGAVALFFFIGTNLEEPLNRSSRILLEQSFDCPNSGDHARSSLGDFEAGASVRLNNYNDGVCTLWLIGPGTQRLPLARSFHGQPWEKYAGTLEKEIDFDCKRSSCLVSLPVASTDRNYYELSSYPLAHSSPYVPPTNKDDNITEFEASTQETPSTISVTCPSADQSPESLGYLSGPIVANIPVAEEGLCTIWRIGPGTKRTPIARSYNSNDWEIYANNMAHLVSISCLGNVCTIMLPELTDTTQFYEVASFGTLDRARDVLVARFLEQATFGPTVETMTSFPEQYADWIEDQMTMDYISHREFFRSRANARKTTTSEQGAPTHPCEAGSYYRKYAMATKDAEYFVTISTDSVTNRKILSRDGQARTVFDTPTLKIGRNTTLADGT